jgi:hypothetical protein
VRILVFVLMCLVPAIARAQSAQPMPEPPSEPQGVVPEPGFITQAVLFADRHLGKGDLNNGFYIDFADMIPGAGWASAGPGWRQWFGRDTMLLDGSAAISWNGYKRAQARVELPKFLKSRLALGSAVRWVDYDEIDYFGAGPDTLQNARMQYGIRATHAVAHATLKPFRWLGLGTEIGVLSPDLTLEAFDFDLPAIDQPTFVPAEVSLTIDARNFPEHPTAGVLIRAAAAHYDDRDTGAFTFRRYDGEAAAFIPFAGERFVLAMHGWAVSTETEDGRSVPFYMLPSLGGAKTLRSFTDYRFHDRHMVVANVELKLALMTHLDFAVFGDAGNVAPRFEDLDFAKRSYGVGLRLHTRRQTFALLDVAHGAEGWRVLARLNEPLSLSRLTKRAAAVPFVP